MTNIGISADESLYEADFYTWTQVQAALLKSGRLKEADLLNIIEEIETLGRSEQSTLLSAYRLICLHQLKRMFQPERSDSRGWTNTIVRERNVVEDTLLRNPGLKPKRNEIFRSAYGYAVKEASSETGLAPRVFPKEPPFTIRQIEDDTYWADAAAPFDQARNTKDKSD